MKYTRSRRRVRRVTRRRGGNGVLRRCFGRLCGYKNKNNENEEELNNATKNALGANASARTARNRYYTGLYDAYTGLPGMRATSVRRLHEIYENTQKNITEQRKKAVLRIEQNEIDRLKSQLAELKRGRPRRGSIEGKEAEIMAAEARKKQIEGMTHNQLVGK